VRLHADPWPSVTFQVRRTRWRIVLGHFRWGWGKDDNYGRVSLPFMLVHWITRNRMEEAHDGE